MTPRPPVTDPSRRLTAALLVATVVACVIVGGGSNDPARASDPQPPIPVGAGAVLVAFTPDDSQAYVVIEGGIAVVDVGTQAVTTPVTEAVNDVAFSPDGALAYVALVDTDAVGVVDVATGAMTSTTYPLTDEPFAVAVSPDGTTVWAALFQGDVVDAIDTATGVVTPFTGFNGPNALAVAADGTVYVTNDTGGQLGVIRDGAVTFSNQYQSPQLGVAASGSNAWVSAGDASGGTVYGVDTSVTPAVQTLVAPTTVSPGGLAISPDGTRLWVAFPAAGTVVGYDTATLAPVVTVTFDPGSGPLRLAISHDGTLGYVALEGEGAVGVFDPQGLDSPPPSASPSPSPPPPSPSASPTPLATAPATATAPRLAESGVDIRPALWAAAVTGTAGLLLLAFARRRTSR